MDQRRPASARRRPPGHRAAGDHRHPGWRPARADARSGRCGDGVPGRRPRSGSGRAPRPSWPTSSSSAAYGDVDAALRLAERCSVITYELEHIDAVGRDGARRRCSLSGPDRTRSESPRTGLPSAPSSSARVSRSRRGARFGPSMTSAARRRMTLWVFPSGSRRRLAGMTAAPRSGSATPADVETALDRLGRGARDGRCWPSRELPFEAELSVVVARGTDGQIATFPVARNRHDEGILVESVAPAPVPETVADCRDGHRRATRDRDGPCRHADRRAVPARRRIARRQRARAARPQQRSLDDRRRRDVAVRAAHPGDLRACRSARRTRWHRRPSSTCSARADGGRRG